MTKQIFAILGGGLLAFLVIGLALRQFSGKGNILVPAITSIPSSLPSPTVVPTITTEKQSSDGKGIIERFLKAISDRKSNEAVSMMASKVISDDSKKQAWAVQFNAFKSLMVKNIEPSMKEEWTKEQESYKVTIDVEMKPESANDPIPYYGYEKGINVRWVTVEKTGGEWKILGIATGP